MFLISKNSKTDLENFLGDSNDALRCDVAEFEVDDRGMFVLFLFVSRIQTIQTEFDSAFQKVSLLEPSSFLKFLLIFRKPL